MPWKIKEDPKTKKKFYFNTETKESSWKKPEGFDEDDMTVSKPDAKKGEWVEKEDPKTKKKYYYNKATKETVWKKPADFVEPISSSPKPPTVEGKNDWVEKEDPKTNKIYYYNKVTKETSWKKPADFVEPVSDEQIVTTESESWEEKVDPKTNKIYYYNKVTKETSWKKPKEVEAQSAVEAAATSASSATPATNKNDWVEKEDPKTNKKYYFNKVTKETVWKKPADFVETPEPQSSTAAPAAADKVSNWAEKVDPKTNKIYYYNKVTKETSWKKPKELEAPSTTQAAATSATSATAVDVTDWVEQKDPKSGKSYYYNKKTNETTWKPPAGFGEQHGAASTVQHHWVEKVDPKSGKKFYYNRRTKETVWNKPAEMLNVEEPQEAAENADEQSSAEVAQTNEDAIMAGLGREWVKRYEHKTSTVYVMNTITGEKRWLDSVTGELTTKLQLHEVPLETVFVFCGNENAQERQTVCVFMGTRWEVLDYKQHNLPYDFHSVHAVKTGVQSCLLIGMRREPGALHAAMTWNGLDRSVRLQQYLLQSYSPGAAFAAVPRGMLATGGATTQSLSDAKPDAVLHDLINCRQYPLPPLNTARSSHSLAVVDAGNEVRLLWFCYAIGGFDGKRKTAAVERYVLGNDRWDVMAPLAAPRSGHCSFVIDKTIYVVGGRSGYSVVNTMEAMHIQTDAWSPMAEMKVPRCSFGTAEVGTYVLAVGGYSGTHWLSSVEAYDHRIDVWRDIVALPSPCSSMGVVTLKRNQTQHVADEDNTRRGKPQPRFY